MRPEDEKLLDELVPDRQMGRSRSAAQEKRGASEDPDYFTGDPEADAYGWFDAKRSFAQEAVTATCIVSFMEGQGIGAYMDETPEGRWTEELSGSRGQRSPE